MEDGEAPFPDEPGQATPVEDPPLEDTRSQVLARHQKEIKDLQNKEIALKKAAAKGSKAEQKAKKKQVEEEVSKLDVKMRARHAKELAILGEDGKENDGIAGVITALSGLSVSVSGVSQVQRPSKSQKRREKRAQEEVDREKRIQEEQNNSVSDRVRENEQLDGKLHPLGLSLKEIKPDGHCLYRAVEDQLALYPGLCPQSSYQELRVMAASYMRSHADDFVPFFGAENGDADSAGHSTGSFEVTFESYCQEVESTAAWGGQLELGALAHALKKHIIVYSGDLPEVEMGKEYEHGLAESELRNPSLRLSYHRYAYGLGEHYNSVIPLLSASSQDV